MRIRIVHIIYLLIIYIPFENLILKYLPVTDLIYSLLRSFPEFVIYILFTYVALSKVRNRSTFNKTPINRPVILFIAYTFLLILINNAPIFQALYDFRGLIRYLALFYIITNIHFEYALVNRLIKSLIIIAVFQSVITIYHHYFGISEFWYPRANTLEIGGKTTNFKILNSGGAKAGRELGIGIGTFGDSVFLSLFLVISAAITLPYCFKKFTPKIKKRKWYLLSFILIMLGLLFTYSRGAILLTLMMIPLSWLLESRKKQLVLLSVLVIMVSIPMVLYLNDFQVKSKSYYINPRTEYVNPLKNISSIFSSDYGEKTLSHSRGYTITVVGGALLKSLTLFGYGPAMEFAIENAIKEKFKLVRFNNVMVINDVYWIAFIIYFGFIGLFIFLYILYKLFKTSIFISRHSERKNFQALALSMALILITSVPYAFIIRTFVFRQYSFYFWALAALMVIEWQRIHRNQKIASEKNESNLSA